ncbi:hypothetical protein OUZ56_027354 [Daphnia magna]|uniref:Uncharacterized protein n=1 Tax=Daphnia magna TaxID=35525 RepID=A0ABQ9ZQW4_9CRUS|nr:hypothetical protein OUZ56_027354 [Daphnia magna]
MAALDLGCMGDLMWLCMWEVPLVMFADCSSMSFDNLLCIEQMQRYFKRVLLFSVHNRNGFEEDIDGVLVYKKYKYMFLGRVTEEFRILILSYMLCACKTKG